MANFKTQAAAAEAYAATGNASHAARVAKVDRSTLTRWLKSEDFLRLVEEASESELQESGTTATQHLNDLVTKAVQIVEKGLEGEASVSAGRLALDVIKVAAQLAPKDGLTSETPPLAALLKELDAQGDG